MPFFSIILAIGAIFSVAIINAPTVSAIENPYDTLTKGARGWYALRFIRDHNQADGAALSTDAVDKMLYVPERKTDPDCFDINAGYLLEPTKGIMARDSGLACGAGGDSTTNNALNAAFQGIGYNSTTFIVAMGYTKQSSGLYEGGSITDSKLNSALSAANVSPELKGSALGMPSVASEPTAWMQYLDLLAGIEKGACLKAGLREFPDPAGNISLVEDDVTIKRYRVEVWDKTVKVAVGTQITCAQAVARLGDGDGEKAKSFVAAYAMLVAAAPKSCEDAHPLTPDNTACIDGFNNKGDRSVTTATAYCSKYPWASASTQYTACYYGVVRASGATGGVIIDSRGNTSGAPGGKTQTCAIDSIGWIVCPVMNFIAGMNDGLYGFIASFLVVQTDLFTRSSSTYEAWDVFKNYANVMFVIVFLIIIYSQITSAGISNYGVKRMLPKIIIAAILVNLSFYICQLAVDLSNIAGYGIKALFDSIGGTINITAGATTGGYGELVGKVLAGAIGLGGIAALWLAVTFPVLIAAFFALALIGFILIARQALIVLLIVIAPLAFVAYLLPNTESLFKKWSKLFFSLLMLFPVISAVFGASALAAKILGSSNEPIMKLGALAATALPLFVVPGLLKGSLAATGKLGAKMQGWGDKATGRVGAKVGESRLGDLNRHRQQRSQIRQARSRAGIPTGKGYNPLNWGSHVGADFNRLTNHVLPKQMTSKYQNKAASIEDTEFAEQQKSASAAQQDWTVAETVDAAKTGKRGGRKLSEAERAASIDRAMSSGGISDRMQIIGALAADKANTTRRLRNRAVTASYAKGDQNILGTRFGDQVVDEGGSINSENDLKAAAVANAAGGNVSAAHLVQSPAATDYLVTAVINSGNTTARKNLKKVAADARVAEGTRDKITRGDEGPDDKSIDASFKRL